MVALPFCNLRLKTNKPRCKAYPQNVLRLGDAIRKRRLDLRLLQKDVAEIIGCDKDTITNWENGHRSPTISHTAKITEFLGYDPFPEATTLAERLVNYRKARGLRQTDLALQIGINPSTLARFERGERYPTGKCLTAIENVAKDDADQNLEGGVHTPRVGSRPINYYAASSVITSISSSLSTIPTEEYRRRQTAS
jgi:transcriptional regulator with XRE-family HTH domain